MPERGAVRLQQGMREERRELRPPNRLRAGPPRAPRWSPCGEKDQRLARPCRRRRFPAPQFVLHAPRQIAVGRDQRRRRAVFERATEHERDGRRLHPPLRRLDKLEPSTARAISARRFRITSVHPSRVPVGRMISPASQARGDLSARGSASLRVISMAA